MRDVMDIDPLILSSMSAVVIGYVSAIYRYPVKSMASEALESVNVSWAGLDGDRRWAFVRAGMERSGFPWLTIREQPSLWRYTPRFVEPGRPNDSVTMVDTPHGRELDVVDPALAAELGEGVRVIKQSGGIFDTMPLSLIGSATIGAIGDSVGSVLTSRRFRPNIVMESAGGEPFVEERAVGRELRIGGMRMRVDRRDKRCVMINIDPDTTEKNSAVLRAVAQQRESCLGVYGTTVLPGAIGIGDEITIDS